MVEQLLTYGSFKGFQQKFKVKKTECKGQFEDSPADQSEGFRGAKLLVGQSKRTVGVRVRLNAVVDSLFGC